MNIVYLVFGQDLSNHKQAVFSVFTALLHKNKEDKIIIVTDTPNYYKYLDQEDVIVQPITSEQIKIWRGKHNYVFRVKIKALQFVAQHYSSNPILYLDADTFFYKNLRTINESLLAGNNVMHVNEGSLSTTKSKTKRHIYKKVKGNTYNNVIINACTCMWNAGVVGIAKTNTLTTLNNVLAVSDALCDEKIPMRLVEQLSFSMVLSKENKLVAANKCIGHYWGNKFEWNLFITDFFIKNHFSKTPVSEVLPQLQKVDLTKIPVSVKTSSTGYRLKKIIDKLFKPRKKEYAK